MADQQEDITMNFQLTPAFQESLEIKPSTFNFDPTDYSENQLIGLSAAAAVYITAFARPPFSETWTIKEGADLLSEKFDVEKFSVEDPAHLFSLIKLVTENPQSIEVKEQANSKKQTLVIDEKVEVETAYPLEEILHTYGRDIKDPRSLVLLKYENKAGLEKNIDLTLDRLTQEELSRPTGIVRVRNIENSVEDAIVEEVGYYLTDQEEQELKTLLQETPTAYLGEVANIGMDQRLMLTAIKNIKEKFVPLPKQLVLFTKVGSSILPEEEIKKDPMLLILQRVVYNTKNIELTQKKYSASDGSGVVVNIYSVTDED